MNLFDRDAIKMRYHSFVNVPAARTEAEHPASVTWCCGRPTGPDSNAWLPASPKIGPQVTSCLRLFRFCFYSTANRFNKNIRLAFSGDLCDSPGFWRRQLKNRFSIHHKFSWE